MSSTTAMNANIDLNNLPKTSLCRLYDPATTGNSFALDGFPALVEGKDWFTRLVEIIEEQGALNMTTNQTLFKQLTDLGVLDDQLKVLKEAGKSTIEVYQALYTEAALQAGSAFETIHAQWAAEGRISQEASALITELGEMVSEVQRISHEMEAVAAFTKIPNIPVGPDAIEQAIGNKPAVDAKPVCPNVTLVFSDKHYLDTTEGYLRGLEQLVQRLKAEGVAEADIRTQIEGIHSVNSLFVSRLDRVVDPMIDEATASAEGEAKETLTLLKGKVAVAHAKKVYQLFETIFLGKPFADPEGLYADEAGQKMLQRVETAQRLYGLLKENYGANPQRLLIASSGVKAEQPYSPLLYVLPFLGPFSANTMPEKTLAATSTFIAELDDATVEALKTRNVMNETLPAIETSDNNWDKALLGTEADRTAQGVHSVSADWVLAQTQALVLTPAKTSFRQIGDELRDAGAASFMKDEEETLKGFEEKLSQL